MHEQSDEADDESDEIQPSVAGSEATTVIQEVHKPHTEIHDTTNFLSPVKPRFEKVKEQLLPAQFSERNRFERMRLQDSFDAKDWDNELGSHRGSG